MHIAIVTPVGPDSTRGNGVTARRWVALLRQLGHEVELSSDGSVAPECELLVALHARKSAPAIAAFAERSPGRPIVLAMTGTDLYCDLPDSNEVLRSVELAERVVVLQPAGVERLPTEARIKARVIRQSVSFDEAERRPPTDHLAVCVLAHLRDVKDPLLAARAVALLPPDANVHVTLAGEATGEWLDRVEAEVATNPRFTWVGGIATADAARLLCDSHLLVISSSEEGGANVVSEAIVAGVPVLASRIDGNLGMLGADYEGYFAVGDVEGLAGLLSRVESDDGYRFELAAQCRDLVGQYTPERECESWRQLLADLG